MRKAIIFAIFITAAFGQSCDIVMHDTVRGNGSLSTDTRNIPQVSRIKSQGNFDIDIVLGGSPSLKIEADANLIPYILTSNEDGKLVIHTKDHVDLSSDNKIKVTITTDKVEELEINGNGNITSSSKITGGDHLKLGIYGNGDITLDVNSPKVESTIAGNGNINLTGETKDSKIEIDGNGDYKAEGLLAENAEVHINGSGGARLACSVSLDVRIAGSGDVFYKDTPSIHQTVIGSGNIKQIQ